MGDFHFDTLPGEPKRDRWGRYILPDPETGLERSWTRVTTVSGILSDRYNLEKWGKRMVALGLARRPDILALLQNTPPAAKQKINKLVDEALEAGNVEKRAELGTAIHAATERRDRGDEWSLPAPYDKDVEAYATVMDERGIVPLATDEGELFIERIVVNPELGVAGTLDRINVAPDWPLPRVCDLKTGGTVYFSELDHSIQQAMYANATHYYDSVREELVPMPEVDKTAAVIIHLPAGEAKCELHELNISAGYEAARVAIDVHGHWRKRKDLSKSI